MEVGDQHLDEVRQRGFTLVPGFLGTDELDAPTAVVPVEHSRNVPMVPDHTDPYWNDQTRHDVQRRYPAMDMAPYETRA